MREERAFVLMGVVGALAILMLMILATIDDRIDNLVFTYGTIDVAAANPGGDSGGNGVIADVCMTTGDRRAESTATAYNGDNREQLGQFARRHRVQCKLRALLRA